MAPHVKFEQLVQRCDADAELVRRVFDTVAACVDEGIEVRIEGFGTFRPFVTAPRTVTNRRVIESRGGPVEAPSRKVIKFKMSPALRRKWNDEEDKS